MPDWKMNGTAAAPAGLGVALQAASYQATGTKTDIKVGGFDDPGLGERSALIVRQVDSADQRAELFVTGADGSMAAPTDGSWVRLQAGEGGPAWVSGATPLGSDWDLGSGADEVSFLGLSTVAPAVPSQITINSLGEYEAVDTDHKFSGGKLCPPDGLYAAQTNGLFQGSGEPPAGTGSDGDVYFRTDTPGVSTQRIYIKSSGSWVGIV